MRYDKEPKSIDQQLELLNERGLIIDDPERAALYLRNINYYHLSSYFKFFQNADDKFKKGTKFSDVLVLYKFDNHLRLLLLEKLERIEQSFKCRLAYELSLKKNSAFWFLDEQIFSCKAEYDEIIKILDEELSKNKDDQIVKHYFAKYGDPPYPPIWIWMELLSFGECVKICRKLIISYRNKVSRSYGEDERYILNWVHCLSILRNLCAHHCRLWNRDMVLFPAKNHKKYRAYFSDSNRLFNNLVILQILLNKIDKNSLWLNRLEELIQTCNIDISHMGFPDDWKNKLESIKSIT